MQNKRIQPTRKLAADPNVIPEQEMSLSYKFNSSAELLEKLKRDQRRVIQALQADNEIEMCDFLFDFVITSHSLRDWIRKDSRYQRPHNEIHEVCNQYPVLEACRDLANSHKHFDFTTQKPTRSAHKAMLPMFDFYFDDNGHMSAEEHDYPTIAVLLSNGNTVGLCEFMDMVMKAWNTIFAGFGMGS